MLERFIFSYKRIKDNRKLSGQGRDEQWPYFEMMEQLLASDPSIEKPPSIDSMIIGMFSFV